MQQRQDTFAKLEKSIQETAVQINECQNKNSSLSSKLKDLDKMIESERKRWKERIAKEREELNHRFQQNTQSQIKSSSIN